MKQVAKIVIIDPDDKYLLFYRAAHPAFGDDPDLPGGTLETGESITETMVREVQEEAGIDIDAKAIKQVFAGTEYSKRGTRYVLFVARVAKTPEVTLSWEHKSYVWLDRDSFLQQVSTAKDSYMRMVYDVLK